MTYYLTGMDTLRVQKRTPFYLKSPYLTCAGSLAFPGVGLRGFGVEGASPAFEEPGISFLRLGARSNPFP